MGESSNRDDLGCLSSPRARERDATDALARSIASRLPMCSRDELRVLDVILERVLKIGRESYAPLDLARDERDWGAEAAAEIADTLFYLSAREVAANDRRIERLRCEVADEIAVAAESGSIASAVEQAINAGRERLRESLRDLRDAPIEMGVAEAERRMAALHVNRHKPDGGGDDR